MKPPEQKAPLVEVASRKESVTDHAPAESCPAVIHSQGGNLPDQQRGRSAISKRSLSRRRVIFAVLVAVVADGLQIAFQAFPIAAQVIDVVAMILTTALLGFHLLLLPTFALELVPIVDMVPTWTGCVLAVIALRKKAARNSPPG